MSEREGEPLGVKKAGPLQINPPSLWGFLMVLFQIRGGGGTFVEKTGDGNGITGRDWGGS